MRLRFFFLSLVLVITSCTAREMEREAFPAWSLPGQPRDVVQVLTGRYGEQAFQFQVRLSLTTEKMQLVGLNALGQRAFSILWDENGVAVEKADGISDDIKAVDILKVIIATYWPVDHPMQSRVADRTQDLQISYQTSRDNAWNETVEIRDLKSDYEMTIISYGLSQ